MAQFITVIPNEQIQRVIDAYKHKLQEGEAVDLENPTPSEIQSLLSRISRENVQREVDKYEHQKQIDTFEPIDLEMS